MEQGDVVFLGGVTVVLALAVAGSLVIFIGLMTLTYTVFGPPECINAYLPPGDIGCWGGVIKYNGIAVMTVAASGGFLGWFVLGGGMKDLGIPYLTVIRDKRVRYTVMAGMTAVAAYLIGSFIWAHLGTYAKLLGL